ncbi:diol dehydratase reactivase subunit alpha [Fictibacillus terranigra]|uniref:Diol dehydratase reactivase subunit alpha n=1 Tax=Fictibacillus terranigra TaxID=3058424 RepID=A0ABT8E518_9BACL|nr:diol dehydratase reactivase subunit alpha [Fictibacillus sp. CENA-BCM004]MDN4073007.1 diol dehydratase reactivase subunit alpha [Fictibacillus sp. CENA-BCM004]
MATKILAGVDIGNSSTEVAIAKVVDEKANFLSEHLVKTTGIKGTVDNVKGIGMALREAAKKADIQILDIDIIRLNDAVPVIGDLAMDLISETIITESSMIGHNPDTPGGAGLGVGITVLVDQMFDAAVRGLDYIVVIPKPFDYEWAAHWINKAEKDGISITGAIVQKDDGVLIHNRLHKPIPIVDEVSLIEKVPLGKMAAIEVALPGHVIRTLSNPYGLSTVFQLNPEQTKQIALVAKALVGNRSAVVIRTPQGEVVERKIEAGRIKLAGTNNKQLEVSINDGAGEIMRTYDNLGDLLDVKGETGTNVGGMFNGLRHDLAELTGQSPNEIKISDFLAVDAIIPTSISGSMAGELSMESGVALASMVKTNKVPVQKVAALLEQELGVRVEIGGIEAEMAILGSLTTPGTRKPIVILDMGGGSTDAAMMNETGKITSSHLAGAGDMVTMLINSELALGDKELAERIKKNPLGKVMSLFHMQLEDGTILFSETPFPPHTFGKVVIREESGLTPLTIKASMDKIRDIRRSAKRRVFVTNVLRALKRVVPTGNLKHLSFVVMVGGSALDFEIPQMLTEELGKYGIVAGFANIRGTEGPRNAVATGLVLSSVKEEVLK